MSAALAWASRPHSSVISATADLVKALFVSCLHGSRFPLLATSAPCFAGIEGGLEGVDPSQQAGEALQVLIVDPAKGRLGIVLDQPLHPARRFLVRQARDHGEGHIDACRDPGRIHDGAARRPAFLYIARTQLL